MWWLEWDMLDLFQYWVNSPGTSELVCKLLTGQHMWYPCGAYTPHNLSLFQDATDLGDINKLFRMTYQRMDCLILRTCNPQKWNFSGEMKSIRRALYKGLYTLARSTMWSDWTHKINYDIRTNVVRPHAGRMQAVFQYDALFNSF